MSTEPDAVEIKAALEDRSLSLQAKSRAIAALDHLVGGIFNIPGEWFQGQADIIRERMRGRAEAINAEEALENLEDQEKIKALRSAENKQETIRIAIDQLSDSAQEAESGEIDHGWFDIFDRYASTASNDEARAIWGMVLAKKIARPSAVSASTLHLIASLNAITAKSFEELRPFALHDAIIAEADQDLTALLDLQGSGLIMGVGSMLRKTFPVQSMDTRSFSVAIVYFELN